MCKRVIRPGVSKTAAEELRIGRRAAEINQLDRAARGFAAGRALWNDRDRFTYATVLARLNRGPEAVTLFDGVTTKGRKVNGVVQNVPMLARCPEDSDCAAPARAWNGEPSGAAGIPHP